MLLHCTKLPPPPPQVSASALSPVCRQLLPGQMRYGEYFFTLLHRDKELPPTHAQPLLLRRIVCNKLSCFADAGLAPGGCCTVQIEWRGQAVGLSWAPGWLARCWSAGLTNCMPCQFASSHFCCRRRPLPARLPTCLRLPAESPVRRSRKATAAVRTLLVVFQSGRQVFSQGASLAPHGEEEVGHGAGWMAAGASAGAAAVGCHGCGLLLLRMCDPAAACVKTGLWLCGTATASS